MILDEIIAQKREDLSRLHLSKLDLSLSDRDFLAAMTQPGLNVIAELKQKSPSTGVLCENYVPATIAQKYQAGGAAALSILTDTPFFGGSLDDLQAAKAATHLPVLCKDFIIDVRQIHLARHMGADAVLLIMRVLNLNAAKALKAEIEALGMLALIEIFDTADLEKALALDPKVLMINHRDLDTLKIDFKATSLIDLIPKSIPIVAASGIQKPEQVLDFDARIKAVLIGTSLMRSADPAAFIREIKRLTCL